MISAADTKLELMPQGFESQQLLHSVRIGSSPSSSKGVEGFDATLQLGLRAKPIVDRSASTLRLPEGWVNSWLVRNKQVDIKLGDNGLEAVVMTEGGETTTVPSYDIVNIPKEIQHDITHLRRFCKDTWVDLHKLSDGSYRVNINPRLRGGGWRLEGLRSLLTLLGLNKSEGGHVIAGAGSAVKVGDIAIESSVISICFLLAYLAYSKYAETSQVFLENKLLKDHLIRLETELGGIKVALVSTQGKLSAVEMENRVLQERLRQLPSVQASSAWGRAYAAAHDVRVRYDHSTHIGRVLMTQDDNETGRMKTALMDGNFYLKMIINLHLIPDDDKNMREYLRELQSLCKVLNIRVPNDISDCRRNYQELLSEIRNSHPHLSTYAGIGDNLAAFECLLLGIRTHCDPGNIDICELKNKLLQTATDINISGDAISRIEEIIKGVERNLIIYRSSGKFEENNTESFELYMLFKNEISG